MSPQESIFGQDLNGDSVIGVYAAPGSTLQISQPLSGASGVATVGAGAALELTAADFASVTFAASTGMLKLDQPSTFTGEIFGFTGTARSPARIKSTSRGINFNTVQDSYANGVLTVTDGTNTAHLNFSGSYVLGNFDFASDSSSGTIVYDPPVPASPVSGTNIAVATDHSNDALAFHPNLGATGTNHTSETNTVFFDHAAFDVAGLATVHDLHESQIALDAAHDWIAFHANAGAQQHHHGFLA